MKFYKRNKFIGMQEPMISYILCILETTQASPPTPIENRRVAKQKKKIKCMANAILSLRHTY